MPAQIAEPLFCPVPEQTPPEQALTLRCLLQPGIRAGRLNLYYRPAGSEAFTALPMARSRKGWYGAVVPASATTGKSLQFYVEGSATPRLNSGSSDSPNLIMVRDGAEPVGEGVLAAAGRSEADEPPALREEENPLAEIERERESEGKHVRSAGRMWLGLGLGSAYGWQAGGPLEFRRDQAVAAGMLAGGLAHLLPELGYQLNDRLSVSLQLRLQYIPTEGSGDATQGKPATRAFAALLRGSYSLSEGNLRPFFSAAVGGGDGFRLKVAPSRSSGLVRSDTVRGGPAVAGGGAGLVYHFSSHFAWPTEVRALVGLPDLAAAVEVATGIEVAF